MQTEQREVIPRHQLAVDDLRPPVDSDRHAKSIAAHDGAEDLVAVADVLVHRIREGVAAVVAAVVASASGEYDDGLRVLHGKQAQNQLIDQREDGGIGADAQARDSTATALKTGAFRKLRIA